MKFVIYPTITNQGWQNLSTFSAIVSRMPLINREQDQSIEVVSKDEMDSCIKIHDENVRVMKVFQGLMKEAKDEIEKLKHEIETLRHFGNKECTAMADEALETK